MGAGGGWLVGAVKEQGACSLFFRQEIAHPKWFALFTIFNATRMKGRMINRGIIPDEQSSESVRDINRQIDRDGQMQIHKNGTRERRMS